MNSFKSFLLVNKVVILVFLPGCWRWRKEWDETWKREWPWQEDQQDQGEEWGHLEATTWNWEGQKTVQLKLPYIVNTAQCTHRHTHTCMHTPHPHSECHCSMLAFSINSVYYQFLFIKWVFFCEFSSDLNFLCVTFLLIIILSTII